MKPLALFLILFFLNLSCVTIKVYETPETGYQVEEQHEIIRSGEFIDFGNHKAEVFSFGKEKSPQGVWPLKYKKKGDTLAPITSDMNKEMLLILDGQVMPKGFSLEVLIPSQIERITVLKDSIASAKYGHPAQQGVIEILLKKKE